MTDIVEWLRTLSTWERRKHGSPPDVAMAKAADEIERLRSEKAAWQGVQLGTADIVKELEKEIERLHQERRHSIQEHSILVEELDAEIERLREALVTAAIPLEVMLIAGRNPYHTDEIRNAIVFAVEKIRSTLAEGK